MKLGDVLRKERESRGIPLEVAASRLGISERQYRSLEGGSSPAETCGPLLAQLSIRLGTQTSRLISITGRPADAGNGSCGRLIKQRREKKRLSLEVVAQAVGVSREVYEQIERGTSPIEEFGPLLLRFAALIEQPVFNLFYPCALPLEKIESYP
ncbi:MAG: helix-turn-helix transcriptional regulator [Acidobacteriota bacterium]